MKILLVYCPVSDDPKFVRDRLEAWLGMQSGQHTVRYELCCGPNSRKELGQLIDVDGSISSSQHIGSSLFLDAIISVADSTEPYQNWDIIALGRSMMEAKWWRPKKASVPMLSILMPTMPHRGDMMREIRAHLHKQILDCGQEIEIITVPSDGSQHIGAVRQEALELAEGKYVAFVDDDDWVADDYIANIVPHLLNDVDAVGFLIRSVWKNRLYGVWRCSNEYTEWSEGKRPRPDMPIEGGQRPPYHITPMRREIALAAGFPLDNSYGEDAVFSQRVVASGMVKTMPVVEEELYEYRMPMIRGVPPKVVKV